MAFRGLKETTKDIDLIVSSGDDLSQLQAVLLKLGYEIVQELDKEYEALGAQRIFKNDDRCRIDIFTRQVTDKLILSSGTRERSERYLDPGSLVVKLVSPEGIFCSIRSPVGWTTSRICSHWCRPASTSTSPKQNSRPKSNCWSKNCL